MKFSLFLAGVALCAAAVPTLASETITYSYDAKGRLTNVARAGTVNSGINAQYAYDKADNRSAVSTSGSANSAPTAPTIPPATNRALTANADNAGTMGLCAIKTLNATANDGDPDGDPLTITTATGPADLVVSVISASQVQIESGTTTGAKSINYTITDGRGGSASNTINVTVSGGVCN